MSQLAQIVSVQLIRMFALLLSQVIRTSSSILMTTKTEIEAMRICKFCLSNNLLQKKRKHTKSRCSALDQLHWSASQRLTWQVACLHIAIWCSASGVGEGE